MKPRLLFAFILTVMIAAMAHGQPTAAGNGTPTASSTMLAGIWRGQGEAQESGLPLVTLTICCDGDILSGAILLSVVHIENGKAVASPPSVPEPILNPTFDGQTLTFQTKFRGPLPPGITSGNLTLTYRFKLLLPDKAELGRAKMFADAYEITGSTQPLGSPVEMMRTAN